MRIAPLFLLLASGAAHAAAPTTTTLDRGWSVRLDPADPAAAAHPRATRWFPATVPGSVQQDLIASRQAPDPFYGTNEGAIQWAGLSRWTWRTTIKATPEMLARDHLDLVFDGLDTFADVVVNGQVLLAADNAFRRWRVPAKAALHPGDNLLELRFRSPIKELQPRVLAEAHPLPGEFDSMFGDEPEGKQTAPYVRKPAYEYGWDWGPRIVTIGPWQAVRLEAWDEARLDAFRISQEAVTDASARLQASYDVVADHAGPATLRLAVTAPDGTRTTAERRVDLAPGINHATLPLDVPHPQRWWPVGYGAQPLYKVEAALVGADGTTLATQARRIGLRTVELRRDRDAHGRGFALVVNGVAVFAKGADVIPFDAFPARVTPAYERKILTAARDANMNAVRVWGGGVYPDDAFYDIADELGLMVWQDFMHGGSITPADPAYRDSVRIEAEEQVDRLQSHPSLVLWAGNNEVLSGWETWGDRLKWKKDVGADEQERTGVAMAILFDQVLRDVAERRDPDAVYWPASPSSGYEGPADKDADGDRHYWDVWGGKKPVEAYLDSCPRFMSEYGLQSLPDLNTIRTYSKPGDWRIDSPVMKTHQKYLKGEGNERILYYIRQRYAEPKDFTDFAYLSQVMQAEGIELGALHHRACRPVTMGSLYWQLNDVWPVASWASVDYYGRWKALQYHAKRFFAPLAIAAEHKAGSTRISLISDRTTPTQASWRLRVVDVDGRILSDRTMATTLPALASTSVATVSDAQLFGGADPRRTVAMADLIVDGATVSRALVSAPPKDMDLPDPGLSARWSADGRTLTLSATHLARAVWIGFGTHDATLSDNAFDMLPGESHSVAVTSATPPAALRRALEVRTLAGKARL